MADRNPLTDPQPGDRIAGGVWTLEVTRRTRSLVWFRSTPRKPNTEPGGDGSSNLTAWRGWCRDQRARVEPPIGV